MQREHGGFFAVLAKTFTAICAIGSPSVLRRNVHIV